MTTYYINADKGKDGTYHPTDISEHVGDFLNFEYIDAVNKEWQVWEYPSGKIYDIRPDKEIPEDGSDYYSHPAEGKWQPQLVEVATDEEKVTQAFEGLLTKAAKRRSWFDKLFGRNKFDNKAEATQLLEAELNKRRSLSYKDLRKRLEAGESETIEVVDRSGIEYQLEMQAYWDDKKEQTIRFVVSIDGGDIKATLPISRSFIKAPDDSFVGE